MKNFILVFSFISTLSFATHAHIDEGVVPSTEPTSKEIGASRSCFQELDRFGCGHPREDLEKFRSCMHNVYSSLSPSCQQIVGKLYRKRDP